VTEFGTKPVSVICTIVSAETSVGRKAHAAAMSDTEHFIVVDMY
jgi:hypothetical protein